MDHPKKILDSNLLVSKNESDKNVDRTESREMVLTSWSNEVGNVNQCPRGTG
ncbi:hypothetical protein MTR_3g080743 [Medicago truncatula]|uniref:Uncharacterized protein n=1 Tax=Medicago truncatula TaxID=3880 RepID=A0A072VAC7_MEDTR|nr:hypothetical protein MTR_3g080743 [Medicago truncatula]